MSQADSLPTELQGSPSYSDILQIDYALESTEIFLLFLESCSMITCLLIIQTVILFRTEKFY